MHGCLTTHATFPCALTCPFFTLQLYCAAVAVERLYLCIAAGLPLPLMRLEILAHLVLNGAATQSAMVVNYLQICKQLAMVCQAKFAPVSS